MRMWNAAGVKVLGQSERPGIFRAPPPAMNYQMMIDVYIA
jgi:hypothetical protein